MLPVVIRNIKDFYDITVFITMMGIALFMIASDYVFFKRVKYKKDAMVTLVIAVLFVVLPFVFMMISEM